MPSTRTRRTSPQAVDVDFAFHRYLWIFYESNRGRIRQNYRELSKKFLDFNDPRKSKAFLREPQFQALEIYVFLKEFLNNAHLHQIFKDWYEKQGRFEGRGDVGTTMGEQVGLFGQMEIEQFTVVFDRMRRNARLYPNYIFALTMGTGKTILMATCIFYEFILANKFPKDTKYCHNALVFAPDKTVLQSLKEIQEFDLRQVVPPEYVNFLNAHLQFHFLEDAGTTLNLLDKSRFNIIISNTQKIILKKQHKEKNATDNLFGNAQATFTETAQNNAPNPYDEFADLYDEVPEDESDLTSNQRFEKLKRLEQLGIFVDEAHHAFGTKLASDMGLKVSDTSLRATIDNLAANLERSGTRVVACFNYTGTPYVGREVLPEVVYAYGLREAIDKGFLKKVKLHGYTNTRNAEFVQVAVDHFVKEFADKRYEGKLPKLAFFASSIEESRGDVYLELEKALARHGIPADRILINDEKATNDDIREFNRLDQPESEKQFILLVNKGKEGWNCRSLFGVAMFRQPKSKVFVLQATMRCLRQIGEGQQTGHVYLSDSNLKILDDELQQNFRLSASEFENAGKEKNTYEVRVVPPPVKIKLKRIHKRYEMREKRSLGALELGLKDVDRSRYKITHFEREGFGKQNEKTEDLTQIRQNREFSEITLVAEIARYLNLPCLRIEELLQQTTEGMDDILTAVNEYNELLYDAVIPRLFASLYDLIPFENHEEIEVELVKQPEKGFYTINAAPENVVRRGDDLHGANPSKSFHLDTYCFDSKPEQRLFRDLLNENKVRQVYFTGMLTHGQSDFFIQYIDPESHAVRSYYPDFVVVLEDGTWLILEVKGDNLIDDPVVQAKKYFTQQIAAASAMKYQIIKGTDAGAGRYRDVLL